MDGHVYTQAQWSDSLLREKEREGKKNFLKEKRYSDIGSAQWRQMIGLSRFKWQGNTQNFKNKIYCITYKFKSVVYINYINILKKL